MNQISGNIDGLPATRRRRSKAWVYYALLAILAIVVGCAASPAAFIGAVAFGAYSVYLFRGGRFVLWIW